jgi:predicted DNA-binding protein (MmcQ/YjbR family)
MNLESIREYCLSLPHATEQVQWGNDLVFKIGGKMFTVACLTPEASHVLSFKCTPEEFSELVEQDGIKPADYVARYHWVSLERWDALPAGDVRRLIADSYAMVREKLPKNVQKSLETPPKTGRKVTRRRAVKARPTSRHR